MKKLGKDEFTARQISKREGLLKLKVLEERIIIFGQAITTLKGKLTPLNQSLGHKTC